MSILIGILGIILTIGVAILMSNDKKNINYRAVVILFVLQIITTFVMLNTQIGGVVLKAVMNGFNKVMQFGNTGVQFVAGGFQLQENASVFFISVLLLIVFTSTLLSVLTYIRVLPLAIKYIGGFIAKITGLPKVESFTAVNSMIFGDTNALLAVKSYIPTMDKNRLFIATTSSMTSVSASIVGAYMTMVPAEYVLVALPLNVFSGLILASIVAPARVENEEEINIKDMIKESSIFEAIGNGAIDGIKVAGIIAAMLIAYIGLLDLINYVVNGVTGMSVQALLGYVLSPVAFIMGVPASEIVTAGSVMGTKIVANEFVAMLSFKDMIKTLDPKTVAIVSTFLISFANFSSIGMIQGAVSGFSGEKASEVAKFGLKMLLVATMASVLTSTIVGLFI